DGLVANERAAKMQSALDWYLSSPLDLLRHDLGEQVGLGEVLGADDDSIVLGATQQHERHQEHAFHRCRQTSLRSTRPSTASASSASSAAGIAPARISVSSTVATPRKMYTPSPPAPIAAAIVAMPTLTTGATATPHRGGHCLGSRPPPGPRRPPPPGSRPPRAAARPVATAPHRSSPYRGRPHAPPGPRR